MTAQQMIEQQLADVFRSESADVATAQHLLARTQLPDDPSPTPASTARRWVTPTLVAAAVFVVAVTTLVLVGTRDRTGHPGAPSASGPSGHVINYSFPGVVTFAYPAGWSTTAGWTGMGGSSVLVYLSSDRLERACITSTLPNNTGEQQCGLSVALRRLDASGIAVTWTQENRPGARLIPSPTSTSINVGGHTAQSQLGPATGECAALGGTEQETVAVADALGNSDTGNVISACLGPRNEAANLAAFTRILASVRWTH